MINLKDGNIINDNAEAIVNTVNTAGYMGKGIALQFKQAFPENFTAYQKACRAQKVEQGKMFVFETRSIVGPKYIINFPTKRHWKGKSRIEDIESGLIALIEEVKSRNISSIAIPPLGCGLGGLNWKVVRPMIENAFSEIPNISVTIYEPHGTPDSRSMVIRTRRPNMTIARALLIKLIQQYKALSYNLTLLEIQKLCYFLQISGENLRLNFVKEKYGPYAENLNKLLERIEGHFIRGYGDSQRPFEEIELLSEAINEADVFLIDNEEPIQRLKKVSELIEGFETPYGMELLSSVHWVSWHENADTPDKAVTLVHLWNERKNKMLKEPHIRIAWKQLEELGWLPL